MIQNGQMCHGAVHSSSSTWLAWPPVSGRDFLISFSSHFSTSAQTEVSILIVSAPTLRSFDQKLVANVPKRSGGSLTGSFALAITIISTFCHLSPPGKGSILSSTLFRDTWPYSDAKRWIFKYARTQSGERLTTQEDWKHWLRSPAGRMRPMGLVATPNLEYASTAYSRQLASVQRVVRCQDSCLSARSLRRLGKSFRRKRTSAVAASVGNAPVTPKRAIPASDEDYWISWEAFFAPPGTNTTKPAGQQQLSRPGRDHVQGRGPCDWAAPYL